VFYLLDLFFQRDARNSKREKYKKFPSNRHSSSLVATSKRHVPLAKGIHGSGWMWYPVMNAWRAS
jgi:hypothetical protein